MRIEARISIRSNKSSGWNERMFQIDLPSEDLDVLHDKADEISQMVSQYVKMVLEQQKEFIVRENLAKLTHDNVRHENELKAVHNVSGSKQAYKIKQPVNKPLPYDTFSDTAP